MRIELRPYIYIPGWLYILIPVQWYGVVESRYNWEGAGNDYNSLQKISTVRLS